MLRIGKMIHHECHSAVKEIMHTTLANSPKVVEFYNDLNLRPEQLRAPKGFIWIDNHGWVNEEEAKRLALERKNKMGAGGAGGGGALGAPAGLGFCTAKERFLQMTNGLGKERKRKC